MSIGGPSYKGTPADRLARIAQNVALEHLRSYADKTEGSTPLTVPTVAQFELAFEKQLEWEFVVRLISEFRALKMSEKLAELHEKRQKLEFELARGL